MSDGRVVVETDLDNSGIEQGLSKLGGLVKAGIAAAGIGKIATELFEVGKAAVGVGAGFEEGMSKVSAISGATGDELAQLTEKAKQMGADTKFSATEASQAFQYMAMAGWKTGDMLNGIGGIMDLAAASGEDLASVSDIVTDAITAFGLSASDSGHFADVLASASSNANTNVSMLGESFKYVAPVAGAMNYSVEDVSTALGLMANASVKGSMAGTSLKTALANMASPTDAMAEVMDKYGISLTNADGSMKTLGEVIGNLRSSLGGLDEATQTATASTLFGKDAMAGMLAIVNASPADYQKLTDAIYNADGTAKNMADTMQDNFKGSVEQLGGSLETLGIQFYEYVQDPLKDVANSARESVDRISSAFTSDGFSGAVEEAGNIFGEFIGKIESSDKSAGIIIDSLKDIGNAAMSLGKTAIPVATKSVRFLWENMDKLIPTAAACASALATVKVVKSLGTDTNALGKVIKNSSSWWKSATKAIDTYAIQMEAAKYTGRMYNVELTAGQSILGVFTGKVSAAAAGEMVMTSATSAMGAALNALPIIAVAGAIGLLVGSVVSVKEKYAQYEEVTVSLTGKQKELITANDELSESYAASKDAKEEAIQSTVAEYGHYENLVQELGNITDENGKVKDGYQDRASVITGELSSALGIELEMTDGVITNYQEMTAAINDVIQKKKAEAIMSAYQADMAEAYTKSSEALANYTQLQKESKAQADNVAEAQEKYNEALKQYENSAGASEGVQDMYLENLAKTSQELENAKAKQEELNGKTNEAKTILEGYQEQIAVYNTLAEALASEDAANIEAALQQITSGYQTYTAETLAKNEEARQAVMAQAATAVDGLAAIQSGAVIVGDELAQSTANSVAKSVENFAGLPGGVTGAINEMGAEASGAMIQALAQANLSGQLSKESQADLKAFIDGFSGLEPNTKEKFVQAAAGALEGVEGFKDITSLAKTNADEFLKALAEKLEVHSPSAAVARIFSYVMPGASEGLDEGKEEPLSKAGGFIQEFLGTFQESNLGAKLQEFGSNVMGFFGIGVSSQAENSKTAGKTNADAANAGAGSVNPESTGGFFANLFSGGIFRGKGNSQVAGRQNADAAKQGAGSVNPSNTGAAFGGQYASGVGSKSGASYNSGAGLADNADSGAGSKSGYTPGSDFGSGFVRGIGDWIVSAAKKAAELASAAYNSAKSWLDEHSPSRKTKKLGNWFSQGLGVGIKEDEDVAVKAAEDMSQQALDAINTKAVFEGVDISKQIALMRSAMNAEKLAIGNTMVMKVVHEIVFDSFEMQGEAGDSTGLETVNQNINIYQPVKSPVETARELKRVGKELAWSRK